MAIQVPPALSQRHDGGLVDGVALLGAKWAESMEQWGGLSANHRILDIGCGPGRMALGIGERFGWRTPAYIGFDVMREEIQFCDSSIATVHPQFRFHHVDLKNEHYNRRGKVNATTCAFPLPDQSVDFVVATSVFTHFTTAEVRRYLQESRRVLAPGGTLFSTWFLLDMSTRWATVFGKARFGFGHWHRDGTWSASSFKPRDAVAFRQRDVCRMLRVAGFVESDIHWGAWRDTSEGLSPGTRHQQDVIVAR